jgi:hypothetical protein
MGKANNSGGGGGGDLRVAGGVKKKTAKKVTTGVSGKAGTCNLLRACALLMLA